MIRIFMDTSRKETMNRIKMITTFFPSFIMVSLVIISYTNLLDTKGLFILGLLLLFPILYLGQGVACAFNKGNIVVSLLVSTITFVIITMVFLNVTALMYLFLYFFIALFGYGISIFSRKNSSKRQ